MEDNIYDFIIVGGGPGGIGASVEASLLGVKNILLIEKGDNHSQTIRKFYKADKRVDKDYKGLTVDLAGHIDFKDSDKIGTLNYFDELLLQEKIHGSFNTEVESIDKENGIFKVTTSKGIFYSKNIIVAIGRMGRPNKPDYKFPGSISNKINFNLEKCSENENILVVGGGNAAAEYALSLNEEKNRVTLNYRKPNFTRLNPVNEDALYEAQKKGEITLILGNDIVELENDGGLIKVIFNDGSTKVFDRIIYAIGGTTPVDFLKKCKIELNEKGFPIIDKNFETNISNLFICGDLATKSGGSIAMALNHAYEIVTYVAK